MKKPFLHALTAAVYIVAIVLVMQVASSVFKDQGDTIMAPMVMLSLLVLSAAFMGYLFLFEPLRLLMENQRREATAFFAKVMAFFACFAAIFAILAIVFLI